MSGNETLKAGDVQLSRGCPAAKVGQVMSTPEPQAAKTQAHRVHPADLRSRYAKRCTCCPERPQSAWLIQQRLSWHASMGGR